MISITAKELQKQLSEQIDALKLFAYEYDNGKRFLFKEMSVKLRVLFHSNKTGNTKSLLSQLNMEDIYLYDSAKLIREQATNDIKAPIHFRFNVDVPLIFRPDLLPGLFKSEYSHWWEKGPIVIDKVGKEYTRKEIVRCVTDNDGGAHVDTGLPLHYYALTRGNAAGWSQKLPNGEEKAIDPVHAVIRQITHEVIGTFKNLKIG